MLVCVCVCVVCVCVCVHVTISKLFFTEQKSLHQDTQAPTVTKASVVLGVIIHQLSDINLPLPPQWVRRKKIIGLIIFHLFGILHSLFYTKTASMSPVTWEAELRLHRLTVAPCKALVFDVTTMPHQPPVLGIEHGRLSRGCLSAK